MNSKTRLLLLLGIIAALGPLSIDLYLSGFPEIAKDLNTEINIVSLSLSSYFIGIALGQLINGPLLDRYGRKKPLLIGFAFYTLSSLGCAAAPDIYSLIALRFVMALGGSVGMVATRAIIRDHFEHNEIARALSALILVFGLAPIFAPMLGSLVLQNFGWRYNFVGLSAYALLTGLLTWLFLKESRGPQPEVSLAPAKVLAGYKSLLADRRFLIYALAGSFGIMAMFAYISGSPHVVREVLKFDEIEYALVFGTNAFVYISASQINRLILKKYDMLIVSKWVSIFFAVFGIGLIFQVFIGMPSIMGFLVNFVLFLSMLGFVNPNLQALAMEPYKEQAGAAAALLGALRMLTGTIASAYISIFHDQSAWPMVSLMGISAIFVLIILWNPRWALDRPLLNHE